MKNVLITGAAQGIGKETAKVFAKFGYNVIINYNTSNVDAHNLAKEIGAFPIKADIRQRAEVKLMVDAVIEKFGKIDVLINNSGMGEQCLFTDITEDMWDNIFAVNVKGVYNVTQEILPHMISKKNGNIINISSIWGMVGASCEVHYSATKGAVIAFTKALAKEVAPSGIRVNCIAPGVIDTKMNGHLSTDEMSELISEIPLGAIGVGADVGELALFLAGEKSRFITGQIISPNGGMVI